MRLLRDVLEQAQKNGIAIGHFNISDLVLLKAVFDAARELNLPIVVGASQEERNFMGVRQIATLVQSLREDFDFSIFVNADHTHSLPEAVEALKAINPVILVEGELGDIGTGSQIQDKAPDLLKGLTNPEEAKQFVDSTGIDILAPAVGNMHGMLKSMVRGEKKKHLDIARIAQIKSATQVLLTLHGGSGTDDEDLRKAIAAGINIVHINTELRVAWRHGLEGALAERPTEIVPYKILPFAVESVKQVVLSRLNLFGGR